MFMRQLGDLAAFDIDNPSGRFMLNLSRRVDRFIAMRLQACIVCRGAKGGGTPQLSDYIFIKNVLGTSPHLSLTNVALDMPHSGSVHIREQHQGLQVRKSFRSHLDHSIY